MINGTVFNIEEMAVHDGPGIRTTVFFKGCPLRCQWCHNPEGLSKEQNIMYKENRCLHCNKCRQPCVHAECQQFGRCIHICPENLISVSGRTVTAKGLLSELMKSAEPLGDIFGGFTFSGGEPLFQPEFLLELCEKLKNYHLCIETSGYADSDTFKEIIGKLDFVIMDIKLADREQHKKYTGVYNDIILKNFKQLKDSGKPYLIRTPLIPGITNTKQNLVAIKEIIGDSDWEQLPYNTMAGEKYKMMGIPFENNIIRGSK